MSMWLMNKTFVEKLDKHRRRFFWQGCNKKRRYYLVKWWWKLETQTGIWQDIVKARYLANKTLANVSPKFSDSPCWKALLKVKDLYMVGRKIKTEFGNLTRVWKDSVNGLIPFNVQFPRLYDICIDQECTADTSSFFSVSIQFYLASGKKCAIVSLKYNSLLRTMWFTAG